VSDLPAPSVAAYRAAARAHLPRERLPAAALGGVLTYIGQAERAIAARDIPAAHRALVAAQQIVAVLRASLDHAAAPRLADHLDAIYAYILSELGRANVEKDPVRLRALVPVIAPLREAWDRAAELAPQTPVLAGGGEVR
jgi:flagellar protein FliS